MNDESIASPAARANADLKQLLLDQDERFWVELASRSEAATEFGEMTVLSSLRKKAQKNGMRPANGDSESLRVAMIGGSTLFPLSDLVEHMLALRAGTVDIFTGDFNNYISEIHDPSSGLYASDPQYIILVPDNRVCLYTGGLTDPADAVTREVERVADELLGLCGILRERVSAEIILCNYILPPHNDLGPLGSKSPASEWNFKKAVNLRVGQNAPNYIHICDFEFIAYQLGGSAVEDEKSWFESKQLASAKFQVRAAKEIAHIIHSLKSAPKKVLALDLDNTLWGGVIGDDGMEGIELGDTSPRGEAFKAFQTYILSLTKRGLLLGVCSKNDHENAIEPFQKHPEMVLREEHIVSFKANWQPKAENLIEMARELDLGLDSFVFIDDNPAEIEIVRQFAPEVTTILLGPDPSTYVSQLKESRLFERSAITDDDGQRTEQYRKESERRDLRAVAVDMDSYLASLEMVGTIKEFNRIDLPRIAQLINKSNQFNLTTRRRTEAEIDALVSDQDYSCFSMRLADRFGDHGLIAVVVGKKNGDNVFEIDTWLMSCRVLKRQVEEQVLNEIARIAAERGGSRIKGIYLPTAKNGMVSDLYPRLGFNELTSTPERSEFELILEQFTPIPTHIRVE